MNVALNDDINSVDWNRLTFVFEQAPLGTREPAALRKVFENSSVCCFAWDDGVLIGAGRALSDGVNFGMIFDVVLLPDYQGQGTGKKIMNYLIERSKVPNLFLYAVPGKESFYQQFGFRKMKTAMARFQNPEPRLQRGYIE